MTKRGVWFAAPPLSAFLRRGASPRAVKTDGSVFSVRRKRKKAAALSPQTSRPRIKFGGGLLNAEIFTILLMDFGKGFKPEFMEKLNLYRGFSGQ